MLRTIRNIPGGRICVELAFRLAETFSRIGNWTYPLYPSRNWTYPLSFMAPFVAPSSLYCLL